PASLTGPPPKPAATEVAPLFQLSTFNLQLLTAKLPLHMWRPLFSTLCFLAVSALAAERHFDFSQLREGEPPPGFRSTVTGGGKPGNWKIVLDEASSLLPSLAPQSHDAAPTSTVNKRAVLGQLAQDPTDEHFPLLIYDEEVFDDF